MALALGLQVFLGGHGRGQYGGQGKSEWRQLRSLGRSRVRSECHKESIETTFGVAGDRMSKWSSPRLLDP